MRKVAASANVLASSALRARALGRSVPKGFSTMMRDHPPSQAWLRPASRNRPRITLNASGAEAR